MAVGTLKFDFKGSTYMSLDEQYSLTVEENWYELTESPNYYTNPNKGSDFNE